MAGHLRHGQHKTLARRHISAQARPTIANEYGGTYGIFSSVRRRRGQFAFGAFWYGVFSDAWKADSKVPLDADNNPQNMRSPVPYITCAISLLLVAGMMRHSFATAGIDTFGKGLLSGAGIGLFFITPWVALFKRIKRAHLCRRTQNCNALHRIV